MAKRGLRAKSLDRISVASSSSAYRRRNSQGQVRVAGPKNSHHSRYSQSMDRSCTGQERNDNEDNNYVTNISVEMDMSDEGDDDAPVSRDDNEVVYGVVPMPNNNVKIVLRKPQVQVQSSKDKNWRGSIVHINSEHSVPYCCTGKDMRSNEIRVVVNQR